MLNVKAMNREDSFASVHQAGKDRCVIKTLMIVLSSHACWEPIVPIWLMTSSVNVLMDFLERDVRTKLICASLLNARMEIALTSCIHMNVFANLDGWESCVMSTSIIVRLRDQRMDPA
jgi:hypothetical protein